MAYAGRLNYGYKGKYLLTLSGRYDGASRLSPENRWNFFPSAALGWTISDEAFFSGLAEKVTHLKMRVSYGSAGNYSIQEYGTQSGVQPFNNSYFGDTQNIQYQFKTTIGNANLGWEKTKTANIGLDVELLNGLITGTIDVYQAKTSDILYLRNLPTSTGVVNNYQNIAATKNQGIEISITSRNITADNFKMDHHSNVHSATRNKLPSLLMVRTSLPLLTTVHCYSDVLLSHSTLTRNKVSGRQTKLILRQRTILKRSMLRHTYLVTLK